MKTEALGEIIVEKLFNEEAKKRSVTVEQLTKSEVEDKAVVPKAEIDEFYTRFQDRLPGNNEAEKRVRLEELLKGRRVGELRSKFIEGLKGGHKVEIHLTPPLPPIVENLSVDDDPMKGPKDAPVTLIEFSDFQCPYCKNTSDILKQVTDKYKDKVRLVYRDFPLP